MAKRKKKQPKTPLWLLTVPALLFLGACVILLFSIRISCPPKDSLPQQTPAPTLPKPTRSPLPVVIDYEAVHSTLINVWFHEEEVMRQMQLEEYLIGVVAAEVPASYSMEALKAQAVAARSYSLHAISHGGCNSHPEANICTNSACCQSYRREDQLRERWGEEYAYYHSCIDVAVMETAGQVALYKGSPIDAMYHASSGGYTEDSEHVYANAIPYLRGVPSPHEEGSRLSGEKRFSFEELVAKVNESRPEAQLTAENIAEQVKILSFYESGRVESLQLGQTQISGKQARKLFSLDSSLFTLTISQGEAIFYTKGFGHGVGMSQSGANGMAIDGKKYDEILKHYYTGIDIGIIGQY